MPGGDRVKGGNVQLFGSALLLNRANTCVTSSCRVFVAFV